MFSVVHRYIPVVGSEQEGLVLCLGSGRRASPLVSASATWGKKKTRTLCAVSAVMVSTGVWLSAVSLRWSSPTCQHVGTLSGDWTVTDKFLSVLCLRPVPLGCTGHTWTSISWVWTWVWIMFIVSHTFVFISHIEFICMVCVGADWTKTWTVYIYFIYHKVTPHQIHAHVVAESGAYRLTCRLRCYVCVPLRNSLHTVQIHTHWQTAVFFCQVEVV